jgi:signal transduction histidine kinase
MCHVTKDRREIVVESRWKVIYDERGRPESVLMVNADITERHALELQLLRAQRLESMGQLASGVAHDLSNTLSPMLMATHRLKRLHPDNESQHLLETLRVTIGHAAYLITHLFSFGKGLDSARVSLQPGEFVRETIDLVSIAFPKSVEIGTVIASDLWTVVGCKTHLYQVLVNLCINAREAMPLGGRLTIEAENVVLDRVEAVGFPDAQPGRYVVIKVTDTGSGIPASIAGRIFDPFFSTKHNKGTGLGLCTVAKIVRSHGGFVSFTSVVGLETQFRVYLPAEEFSAIWVTSDTEDRCEEKRDHEGLLRSAHDGDRDARPKIAS